MANKHELDQPKTINELLGMTKEFSDKMMKLIDGWSTLDPQNEADQKQAKAAAEFATAVLKHIGEAREALKHRLESLDKATELLASLAEQIGQ